MFFYFARESFEKTILFQLTFPDDNQIPTEFFQPLFRSPVPFNIPSKFCLPEFEIGGGCSRLMASRMSMPETTTHLNDCLVFWQNNVRVPRQSLYMQSKTKPAPKEKRADPKFRNRVFAENTPHSSASGNLIVAIHYHLYLGKNAETDLSGMDKFIWRTQFSEMDLFHIHQ